MTAVNKVGTTLIAIRKARGYSAKELAEFLAPIWDVTVSTAQGTISKFEGIYDLAFDGICLKSDLQQQRLTDYLALLNPLEHHVSIILEGIQEINPRFRLNGSSLDQYTEAPKPPSPTFIFEQTRPFKQGWTDAISRIEEVISEYAA